MFKFGSRLKMSCSCGGDEGGEGFAWSRRRARSCRGATLSVAATCAAAPTRCVS